MTKETISWDALIATPGWFLDGIIQRASKKDPEYARMFYPMNPEGQPNDTKAKFTRNMLAALYTANPEDYVENPQGGFSISGQEPRQSQSSFFKELGELTDFRELRRRTRRNLGTSLEVMNGVVQEAWSTYWSNVENKSKNYLLEYDELSAEDVLRTEIRNLVAKAIEKADDLEAIDGLLGCGYGLFPSENETRLKSKEVRALMQAMKKLPFFKQIIELLGRSLETAKQAQTNSIRRGNLIPHKFDLGNDLARVLPAELAIGRRLKRLFLAQFAEGGLLQDGLGRPENQSQGSILVIVDESASMSGIKIAWAKAMAAAAYVTCKAEGRKMWYIPFHTKLGKPRSNLESILTEFSGGYGTDIPNTLRELSVQLGSSIPYRKPEFKTMDLNSMDIMFITDDQSPHERKGIKEKWVSLKKKTGIRFLTIKLMSSHPDSILNEVSDKVITTGSDPSQDFKNTEEVFEWLM